MPWRASWIALLLPLLTAAKLTPEELERRLSTLERARSEAPSLQERHQIDLQLATLHILRAREARGRNDLDRAAADYEQAIELVEDQQVAIAELAWLELDRGRSDRAEHWMRLGLVHAPDFAPLLALRGELAYRDDRLGESLADYQAAAAAMPEESSFAARVQKIERELATLGERSRRDSQHFLVSFDGHRDDAASRIVLDLLETAYSDLTRELQSFPTDPIPVIVTTREDFQKVNSAGPDLLGLFDGKIRIPAGGIDHASPQLTAVCRHELVHALIQARRARHVPRWLHEGLAQLLEPRDPAANDARLRRGGGLEGISLEPFTYPTALSFTAWLDRTSGRPQILALLDALAEEGGENDAFTRVFQLSQEELLESWRRELQSSR